MNSIQTLREKAIDVILARMTFPEAVNFLLPRIDAVGVGEKYITTREGAIRLLEICWPEEKGFLLNAVAGRFDLHSKEDWVEHMKKLAIGLSWDYGYKFQRILPANFDDLRVEDADNEPIRIKEWNGDEDWSDANPGLPLVPFVSLKGARLKHIRVMGSLPKSGTLGCHLELVLTHYSLEKPYENGESLSTFLETSNKTYEGFKMFGTFFFPSDLAKEELENVEMEIYCQLVQFMRIYATKKSGSPLTPELAQFERWDDFGTWEDYSSFETKGKSWEEVASILAKEMKHYSVFMFNPGSSLGTDMDDNEIYMLLSDRKTIVSAEFNFTKLRMP